MSYPNSLLRVVSAMFSSLHLCLIKLILYDAVSRVAYSSFDSLRASKISCGGWTIMQLMAQCVWQVCCQGDSQNDFFLLVV